MLWTTSSPGLPSVGGAVSARLRAVREGVAAERGRLASQRVTLPTVAEFYAGRAVLVTGGSGFMGRMVVEMLLRCCPDGGRVFLVLRDKRGVAAADRLQALLDAPLFDKVRAERPGALQRLAVVPGDTAAPGLGLSAEHRALLQAEVAVIFHLAASVRFDDPFQKAVHTNLRSTRDVVDLARGMPQLKALVHVSTAYTNIDRDLVEERVYSPEHDWRDVLRWADELEPASPGTLDLLGPKVRGFQPNTYVFTKALAEKLIDDVADELPVIISRPSIVVGTARDPFPGWIDNLMGLAGFWVGGSKGVIRVWYSREDKYLDSIPGDIATKTIVLASWARGLGLTFSPRSSPSASLATAALPVAKGRPPPTGAPVVNTTLGHQAGVSYDDMTWVVSEAGVGRIVPYPATLRPPKFVRVSNFVWFKLQEWYHHILFGAIVDLLAKAVGVKPRVLSIYRKVAAAFAATAPFVEKNIDFRTDNQSALQAAIHPDDEADFCFMDVLSRRDTLEGFRSMCVDALRGVLVYAIKEEDNPAKNWKAIVRQKWLMALYHSAMALLCLCIVYAVFQFKMRFGSSA